MFDLIRASLMSVVVATYPSFPLMQAIINILILFVYNILFFYYRPLKNKVKLLIALFIELCVITAYISSVFLIVHKNSQRIKKTVGKTIIYSS